MPPGLVYGVIHAKAGIHGAQSAFWIPDIRFAASGMTPSGVPSTDQLALYKQATGNSIAIAVHVWNLDAATAALSQEGDWSEFKLSPSPCPSPQGARGR